MANPGKNSHKINHKKQNIDTKTKGILNLSRSQSIFNKKIKGLLYETRSKEKELQISECY